MDKMLEQLREYGADVDGAMERFLGDVALYHSCFDTYLEDVAFKAIGDALQREDYKEAFEYAHALKGITGNMALTPIYQEVCLLVEALRKGDSSNLSSYYVGIMKQLDRLKKIQESCSL
ncbi:MAG: Hpt domain-containing protein [Lachnospiraceae bacterium]